MTDKVDTGASPLDTVKLAAAVAILLGGVAGFYLLTSYPLAVRWVIVLASLGVGILVALQSVQGRDVLAVRAGLARRAAQGRVADAPGNAADDARRVRGGAGHGHLLLDPRLDPRQRDGRAGRAGGLTVALRWYVVHAYSNFEHKVSESLRERIRLKGLEDKFGEILVPTEEVVEMRDGQRRRSERKFFPGYVLVQMEMNEDTWHLVRETPKVLGFIGGTPEKPAPITDREANAILRRVEEGAEKPRPKVLFEPGEVVRVVEGPFNDFNGVVESVNYEKSRLQVAVQILGRSTPVELDFGQVEKA